MIFDQNYKVDNVAEIGCWNEKWIIFFFEYKNKMNKRNQSNS